MRADDQILFSAMPEIYAFDESLNLQLQYDRRAFHGKTGKEILSFLVRTGEMCVLSLGSVFKTDDLRGIGPEDFFRVSEDYVFLARLCARYPDRKVHIENNGVYMRLTQRNSLSAKAGYSIEKIAMHLVSMFVGAYYMFKMGMLRTHFFQHILRERGKVLQESYKKGFEAAEMMANLLEGKQVLHPTDEQKKVLKLLTVNKASLPAEFLWLVGWKDSSAFLRHGLE